MVPSRLRTATGRRDSGPAGELARLAERCGIVPEYTDNDGCRVVTSDDTTRALLTAMGSDASTDAAVRRALAEQRRAEAERILAPFAAIRATPGRGVRITLTAPRGCNTRPADCQLVLRCEDGSESVHDQRVTLPAEARPFGLLLKPFPGMGYHRLRATLRCDGNEYRGEQQLVVHPGRCAMPLADGERVFGLWANLYSVRSARNWGFGDFGDLARLATFAGSAGAAFTGINPLHALHNDVDSTSPYSPLSRLFINPLSLDLEAIPEHGQDDASRAALGRPSFQRALRAARAQTHLDYPALWQLKRPLLHLAHRAFVARHAETGSVRGRAWHRWRQEQGQDLDDFATFMALSDAHAPDDGGRRDWRDWPRELHDPGSAAVAGFRAQQAESIDFHRWLQFECDRQLGSAAQQARQSGQSLGLYQDLAIGTPAWAADTWARPNLFVKGVTIGCPPDAFAGEGQDWQLTPLSPAGLLSSGWRYWRGVLRAAMIHAGVLRIDHVMGLFRQYWIPDGAAATAGAYVRYPSEVLLGVLALESNRHNTLVVGEDLGTVPKGLPSRLARRRILSSRVALFERDRKGAFRPPGAFSRRAMLTANTHDLPPLDALWSDDDLLLRRRLGQIPDDAALAEAQRERVALRQALQRRVARPGARSGQGAKNAAQSPTSPSPSASQPARTAAPVDSKVDSGLDSGLEAVPDHDKRTAFLRDVYRWLAATPSPLLGVSLDDLCGETEPVNIPGIDAASHPCWSRRMGIPLEHLGRQAGLSDLLADLHERGGRPPTHEA